MIGVNKNNIDQEIWVFDLESAVMYPMTEKARRKAGVRNEELKSADIQLLDRIEEEKEEEKKYREQMKRAGKDPGPVKKYVFYPDKWGQYAFGIPINEYERVPKIDRDKNGGG